MEVTWMDVTWMDVTWPPFFSNPSCSPACRILFCAAQSISARECCWTKINQGVKVALNCRHCVQKNTTEKKLPKGESRVGKKQGGGGGEANNLLSLKLGNPPF